MKRPVADWGGNVLALLAVVVTNWLANALPIGGRGTGEISAAYPTLFTPAGYTFSIWGAIYLGLAAFAVYQALPAQRESALLARIRPAFLLGCAANVAWILAWHHDLIGISLGLMLVLLGTLAWIYRELHAANGPTTRSQRLLVRLPFSLYLAWISVATLANVSVLQVATGTASAGLDAVTWTWLKLALAGAVGAWMVLRRGDIAFALVVGWAALGIASGQGDVPAVSGAAATVAALAWLLAAAATVRPPTSVALRGADTDAAGRSRP